MREASAISMTTLNCWEQNKRHRKLYLKLNTERSIGKAVDKALHFLFRIHVKELNKNG